MAISLKTAGTWARMVTDGGSVTIPGTPAAGDRMFLFGSWKTYTITVVTPSGWTLIDDFSDGAVAAGNGTGSVHNAAYYRDWQSGDANPTIDYSAAPTEGHWVIMLWTKAGGDTWVSPAAVHAAITAASPWSATASATITVPDASVVMSLVGLRDDSATITRGIDDIDDDGTPAVTWNGNYVESPAAHFTSTVGQDMSGDLGHRFVTTGASGVSLTTAGTPAAAETGTCTWIVQALAQTFLQNLAVESSFTSVLTRQNSFLRTLAVSSPFTPVLTTGLVFQKLLEVTSAMTATLTEAIIFARTLSVTSTMTPVLTRVVTFTQILATAAAWGISLVTEYIPYQGAAGILKDTWIIMKHKINGFKRMVR